MAARAKKSNTTPSPVDSATRTCCGGIGDHTAECPPALRIFDTDREPVELDPPDPALARWEELSDWDGITDHGGDAEDMLPFPRPAWADPDHDVFGQSYISTCYAAPPARVAVKQAPGKRISDYRWAPAGALVSARLYGTGITEVHLTLARWNQDEKKWITLALGISPDEALELADVLRAAVDLFGGDK